ncbi:ADP-heptose synthase / D-glycero-beta-D-manno-heptose 7-phosphate kinase [[Actinomadura] parvosata subsp. kistnae]|uniref:D-beta-D-heptose 1-phosphate adenosyltransferase n=1 Tax=[Actinomadura] parvosata subsp. kistnae TaxID=1909395 RepID=A0A1U9ZT60_9ACTN|nr:PfkB family carbohydrate kinase [Nonomuraea sp. ATCC 55076]AQZ61137.1 D-beta-D-heptose 1-phosphate adenosyltransferase [Nonomuraea sp. ATCC 55076]SPL87480.1 ADP-heptose synthase / D-glycero-beta-D-manno-heptose 7-phosphate kinase [Actinomadura parvosata subsp. kistnae]
MTDGPLVVIGDTLLDVDVEGEADRLCPDAPVPVVDVATEQARPGGAGLAALLAARDGADVVLITAVGDDPDGHRLCGLLSEELDLVRLPLRGGTVRKTRVRARGQTLVRLDSGDGTATYSPTTEAVEAIRRAGAVLVSDYGRGVARMARELLRDLDVPVVWDPHPRGEQPMPGCALLTPSEAEARMLCPSGYHGPDQAARRLVRTLRAGAVAVTTGARGAALAVAGGPLTTVPPPVRAGGQDACGAGDRLAGAAALALRDGAGAEEAVTIGVGEASRFVERGGAASVRVQEQRLGDRPRTALEVARLTRANGGRLIATGGCFDLLHAGHVSLLRRARALGDALVVCVNSDDSVRRLKGPSRPIVDVRDRVEVLRALGCVDAVLVFDEDTPAAAIEQLRPDVWVKGGDYEGEVLPESEVLGRLGAEIVVLSTLPGRSTTNLIREIQ